MKTEKYYVISVCYLGNRYDLYDKVIDLWEGYFSFFPNKKEIKEAIKIWDGINKIPSSLYAKLIAVVDCWSFETTNLNGEVIEISGLNYSIQHNQEVVFTR